jgi:hypothetical protein
LRATVTELARRIKARYIQGDMDVDDPNILALCNLILRQRARNNAQVRRWRQNHVDPRRTGAKREAYLAKQREYMRKYYRKRKRQGLGRN